MGDAAGIGPEIVLKSLRNKKLRTAIRCVIIGDALHLRKMAEFWRYGLELSLVGADPGPDKVEIYDLGNLPPEFKLGVDQAETGRASGENIQAAVELWRKKKIDAICTAPISKRALALGGYDFPGHTEFLASLTGTKDFRMSFFAEKLRVVLLSTHLPILAAIDLIQKDALIDLIRFSDRELGKLLGKKVKLAVAGLNPHASEGGMFGSEEAEHIVPAIEDCRKINGIDVSGPFSPDTIFLRGYKGDFDGVVALYHDQATIAVKSISFGAGVNVTLGLPLIRTSVDHGTAYDIAGKDMADASSMIAAIMLAGDLSLNSRIVG